MSHNPSVHVVSNLAAVRQAKGLTQRELAKISGVSYGMIAQIEQNRVLPKITNALLLAEALDCHVDDILKLRRIGDSGTRTRDM